MKKILFLNIRGRQDGEDSAGLRERIARMDLTGLRRGDAVPENLSRDMDGIWARYIAFCLDGCESFAVNGGEYETLLRRRWGDPRAAAVCFDLRLSVAPDNAHMGFAYKPTGAGAILSDILLAGVRHEVSCMRFEGCIADYGETVLSDMDENWELFSFARRENTAAAPECVRAVRGEMLSIPDYSNVVELPGESELRAAN